MFAKIFNLFVVIFLSASILQAQKPIEISFEQDEDTRAYTIFVTNHTYATHTVELSFDYLENLKSSIELPYYWEVGNGKTELMTLTPIDPTASTDFKYKRKSRKGCSQQTEEKERLYQLPVDQDKVTQAVGFMDEATQDKNQEMSCYAIGMDVPVGEKIKAAKSGTVVEIIDVNDPTADEQNKSIRKILEIEHDDCTFGTYEIQLNSEFFPKAGDKIEVGQEIGVINNKNQTFFNDLVFSSYYTAYEEIIKNDDTTWKNYYKAYVPVVFDSKSFNEKLKEAFTGKPIKQMAAPIMGKKFDAEEYKAKKKAEKKEK
ncbi:MAG: M23 family metallopeptidase [Chitinophagales bacterium]